MKGKFYTPTELTVSMLSEGMPQDEVNRKIEEATYSASGVEFKLGKQRFTIFRNGYAGEVESFHVIERK